MMGIFLSFIVISGDFFNLRCFMMVIFVALLVLKRLRLNISTRL